MIYQNKVVLKRGLFAMIMATTVLLITAFLGTTAFAAQEVTVYKSPQCGCCGKWIAHMRMAGFDVKTQDVNNLQNIRTEQGVPQKLASCHTAVVGDYVVEGHVPADSIKRLLAEQPDVAGIAVPGMPLGAPGMKPTGSQGIPASYDMSYHVLTFDGEGNTTVFESR